ncbi:MAG TPA: hypothetical protein VFE15_15555 [Marmoricola sp.]|nr:hypothetical protein [Marmoricola sp.]
MAKSTRSVELAYPYDHTVADPETNTSETTSYAVDETAELPVSVANELLATGLARLPGTVPDAEPAAKAKPKPRKRASRPRAKAAAPKNPPPATDNDNPGKPGEES